jgi:hypothetical protein
MTTTNSSRGGRRADYVELIWNVVNWPDVADRLDRASGLVRSSSQ